MRATFSHPFRSGYSLTIGPAHPMPYYAELHHEGRILATAYCEKSGATGSQLFERIPGDVHLWMKQAITNSWGFSPFL